MRRSVAIALLAAGFVFPALAQRGGSHGGSAGHSSGGFHGGFAAPHFSSGFAAPHFSGSFSRGFTSPRPYGFAGVPRYNSASGYRAPYMGANSLRSRGSRPSVTFSIRTAGFNRFNRFNRFGFPGWIGLGPLGYDGDDLGYDDSADSGSSPGSYGPEAYPDQSPGEQDPSAFRSEYPPSYAPTPQGQIPAAENATTIVFKDGRPSEQIHNYALTQSTLFVLDQNRRDIPLDQVDLAATENANRAAGMEFQVPATSQ
jgi:hypothetical protein